MGNRHLTALLSAMAARAAVAAPLTAVQEVLVLAEAPAAGTRTPRAAVQPEVPGARRAQWTANVARMVGKVALVAEREEREEDP